MKFLTRITIALLIGIVPAHSEAYKGVCLSSSREVNQQYNSHAYYTYRMKNHLGEKCWHPGTRASAKKTVNPIVKLDKQVPQVTPLIIQKPVPDPNLCDLLCQAEFEKFLEWQKNRF